MRIHSRTITGSIGNEATLSLEWLILGESGEEKKRMALFEASESIVSDQIRPLKFPRYMNQFSFLLRLACTEFCLLQCPDQ